MASPKPRPTWKRRAEARPDEILDAALDEFIAKGFDSARIEDIAAKAGLSKGAVYLYFTGKEALLRALIEREIAPIVRVLGALAEANATDPKAALGMALTRIATLISNPRLFAVPHLVISISGRFPEVRDHYRKAVVEPARANVERLIKRGIENGQFRNVDPSAAARSIIGPILFEAMWTHVLQGQGSLGDPAAFVRSQMDVILGGIGGREP